MGFTLTPYLSEQPVRMFSGAAPATEPGRDYAAVLETDAGRLVLDLTEAETPTTVNSFVFLARNRYFDGIAFHRVLDGFVAQAGDPNTLQDNRARWGTGGPGYGFGLEVVPSLRFDARGVLGMARSSSPNSNGSQFFITLAPTQSLNGMYTVFGRVLEGDAVLDRIARNAGPMTPPATPTRLTRVYIVERAR
ncbi:MAG: peptidylprolyl isomerase [Deltaproteobacteria bacterium]|nr:peptidylprolyl isomerase [Deltaproteobacteria bacterium]